MKKVQSKISKIIKKYPQLIYGGGGNGYEEIGNAIVECGNCHSKFSMKYIISPDKNIMFMFCPYCGKKIDYGKEESL